MKIDFSILERAEQALIYSMTVASPILYFKELEELCSNCGWTLQEYWNTSLDYIDKAWDQATISN